MKVTLRQLEVFDAVATLGSVTGAADKLGMSQSAASSALSDLQIVLGRPLFAHPKGRALQITDEGKRLHPIARSLLTSAQDLERPGDVALEGHLIVGATAMIADTMLPALCVEFQRLHPGVMITIESANAIQLFERMSHFELETVLIENFPDVPGIELTKWRIDELWLVVSPDHELAGRADLAVEDLRGQGWCMRDRLSTTHSRLRNMLAEQLGQLPVAVYSNSNASLRLAAIAGGGVTCLSHSMVQDDVEAGRLVRLAVSGFGYTRVLSLARPRGVRRSRLTNMFDRFLLENGVGAPAPDPSVFSITDL